MPSPTQAGTRYHYDKHKWDLCTPSRFAQEQVIILDIDSTLLRCMTCIDSGLDDSDCLGPCGSGSCVRRQPSTGSSDRYLGSPSTQEKHVGHLLWSRP